MKYNFIKKLEALLISSAVVLTTGISPIQTWAFDDGFVQTEQDLSVEIDDNEQDVTDNISVENNTDTEVTDSSEDSQLSAAEDFSDTVSVGEDISETEANELLSKVATKLKTLLSSSKTPVNILYSENLNIADYVESHLQEWMGSETDVSGVTVSFASPMSLYEEYFDEAGNIILWKTGTFKVTPRQKVAIKVTFHYGGFEKTSGYLYAYLGPDAPYYNTKAQEEVNALTFDQMRTNTSDEETNVTSDLHLPAYLLPEGVQGCYSRITWSTDHPEILQIGELGTDNYYAATLNRPAKDTTILLTAHGKFKLSDDYPNGMEERTRTFSLTVKGMSLATFKPVDTSGVTLNNVSATVKDADGNLAESKGELTFAVTPNKTYTYELSAEGYGTVKGTFTPGEEAIEIPVTLKSNEEINQENQQRLDAVAKAVDARLTDPSQTLLDSSSGTSITAYIQSHLPDYTDAETGDITVTIKDRDEAAATCISEDGTITYMLSPVEISRKAGLKFVYTIGGVSAESADWNYITVGPDITGYNARVQEESSQVTEDTIKGSNASLETVTESLVLPAYVSEPDSSYSQITWSSDNQAVEIGEAENNTYKVTVHRPLPFTKDAEVNLTATFQAKIAGQYKGLESASRSFKVTVPVRTPETFNASIHVRTTDGKNAEGIAIEVKDPDGTPVTAENGIYRVTERKEYSYTVKKEGYTTLEGTFLPVEDNTSIDLTIVTEAETRAAEEKLDLLIEILDKNRGKLDGWHPDYKKDKNYGDYMKKYLQENLSRFTDKEINFSNITIRAYNKSGRYTQIAENGDIIWPLSLAYNGTNITDLCYEFRCDGVVRNFEKNLYPVLLDQDIEGHNRKVKEELDTITFELIRGNADDTEDSVTKAPTLYAYANYLKYEEKSFGHIEWSTDRPDIIEIGEQRRMVGNNMYYNAYDVKMNFPSDQDVQVHLKATITPHLLTPSYAGNYKDDLKTYEKTFTLTIKANPYTEEELQKYLDDAVEKAVGWKGTTWPLHTQSSTGKDPDEILLGFNEELMDNGTLSLDSERGLLAIDRSSSLYFDIYPDIFATSEATTTDNLIFTYTVGNVTVKKVLPITIRTESKETALRDADKIQEKFEETLLNGQDPKAVSKDLPEMYTYKTDNAQWRIAPKDDVYYTSSHPEVIADTVSKDENGKSVLKVNIPKVTTEVTLSAYVSNDVYGKFVKPFYDEHEDLQTLYMHPVSVTVTVVGESSQKLADTINKASQYYKSIKKEPEGTEPGCYPEGTKATLQKAIDDGKALLTRKDATGEELDAAIEALENLIQTTKDSYIWAEAQVTVKAYQLPGEAGDILDLKVSAGLSEKYGYSKPEAYRNQVTAQDAFIAAEIRILGEEDFAADPRRYLEIGGESGKANHGWVTKIFGIRTEDLGYCVNNKIPMYPDDPNTGSVADDTVLRPGDLLTVFLYGDTENWQDLYLYFKSVPSTLDAGESLTLTLLGMHPFNMKEEATARGGFTVNLRSEEGQWLKGVTDENGKVTFQVEKAGHYTADITEKPEGAQDVHFVFPVDRLTVLQKAENLTVPEISETTDLKDLQIMEGDKVLKEDKDYSVKETTEGHKVTVTITFQGIYTGETLRTYTTAHKFDKYRTTAKATVSAPEKREYTCSICGKKETRNHGKKLTPSMKVNVSGITLKLKQKTAGVKVTGLARGDSIKSWKSSNTKIVKVTSKGVITAQKKTGKANITVTLKSGKKAVIKVKVQKGTVKTTKISGLDRNLTIKKGKSLTLKPVISPFTSGEKVTYTTSNKKIATVTSKGKITAKKKGSVNIIVRSGKKAVKIKVTVK